MTLNQSFVTPAVQKSVQAGLGAGAGIFSDALPGLIQQWETVQAARVRLTEHMALYGNMHPGVQPLIDKRSQASRALAESLDETFVRAAIAQSSEDEIVTILTAHATSGKWPWEV
jgi:hypothetical protein